MSATFYPPGKVTLKKGSDVVIKPIDWLWRGYLARGKFHLIGGRKGTGKTTVALALTAALSSGSKLPDGSIAKACKVIIWSGEDDIEDILSPRLKYMGADMENIFFIVPTGNRPFNPATDMAELSAELDATENVGLVIIDPIVSATKSNSHNNGNVRNDLQPVIDLLMKHHCAGIGIHHLTKGSAGNDVVERFSGSLAFAAIARVLFIATKRLKGCAGGSRAFVRAESNIGPSDGGFAYDLDIVKMGDIDASIVTWREALEGSAKDILEEVEEIKGEEKLDNTRISRAKFSLGLKLRNGEVQSNDIEKWRIEESISKRCLTAAQNALGVIPHRKKVDSIEFWYWQLPVPASIWFNAHDHDPVWTPSL
jgi:putative DNA primase/helicase